MKRQRKQITIDEDRLKELVFRFAEAHAEAPDDGEAGWRGFLNAVKVDDDLTDVRACAGDQCEEKGRFLTLFQNLRVPAFILDDGLRIEGVNQAAAEFIEEDSLFGLVGLGGVSKPLGEVVPWLQTAVEDECHNLYTGSTCRLDAALPTSYGNKHFNVAVSRLSDIVGGVDGFVVTLDDISFHIETQKQLNRERNRVSHYLDVVGSIVVVLDISGAVTMVNRTACHSLGHDEKDMLGRTWVDSFVPEEEREAVRDYLYLVFSGQVEVDEENSNHVLLSDGSTRLIQWQNKVLTNDGGMAIGLLCSGIDITEQQAIEDALAEKELWLRSTFVALSEAVLILSPQRGIIDANPAAEEMFQRSNEELVNLDVADLHVDAEHNQRFMELSEAAFREGEKAWFEFPLRRRDGQVFPSENSVSLIIGDDGAPLGIVNVIRDISDRKRAERELRESEEKFRRIFESIEEGYMVADLSGHVQMVNPATCRLFGYAEEELLGVALDEIYAVTGETASIRELIRSQDGLRGGQMKAIRKDGSEIVLEANVHMVMDENGDPVAMEGTFRDITDRIKAEQVLKEREKQYRAFFENNHAIMILVDPKTEDIIDANPAASNFYGYGLDELRSMNLNQINALGLDDIFEEMRRSCEEGRSYFILKHRLADGTIRDVEVYSGPILVQGKQRLYSVIHDVTERIQLEQEMKHLATTDALTGANNRHQFFSLAEKELVRTRRYGSPLSVLMLDIDYFKSINDTYGHHAGDQVLKLLSSTALGVLRETDIFGRLGGEEFAVILPETGLSEAMDAAERLRSDLGRLETRDGDDVITFTVSIGVTLVLDADRSIEEVLNRADEALYKAKRMGRNRVERG